MGSAQSSDALDHAAMDRTRRSVQLCSARLGSLGDHQLSVSPFCDHSRFYQVRAVSETGAQRRRRHLIPRARLARRQWTEPTPWSCEDTRSFPGTSLDRSASLPFFDSHSHYKNENLRLNHSNKFQTVTKPRRFGTYRVSQPLEKRNSTGDLHHATRFREQPWITSQNTVQDLRLPDCSSDSCPDLSWTSSFSSIEGSYDIAEAQDPTGEVPVLAPEEDVEQVKDVEAVHSEVPKIPEEESTMSRRPQILKITDSPNSTLTRRRPKRETSALVATFAPTTTISDAETKCEFNGGDSRFRTLSCGRKGIAATRSLGRSAPDLTDDGKMMAFDGIVQYLQQHRRDLRELLVNNNVVIIEPVRSCRITGATVKQPEVSPPSQKPTTPTSSAVPPRHAFYHPQRRNRELVDEELPDPDTVRRARQLFESTLEMRTPDGATLKKPVTPLETLKRWSDTGSLSSGVSSDLSFCDADATPSDVRSESDDTSDCDDDGRGRSPRSHGNRVSREVLEKIRACGTSVTYYGGRVIQRSPQASNCTMKAVMDEIRENVHFRLVKSNSCGSRLEIAGTDSNNNRNIGKTSKTVPPQEPRSDTKYTNTCNSGPSVTFADMEFEEFEVLDEETPGHSHC